MPDFLSDFPNPDLAACQTELNRQLVLLGQHWPTFSESELVELPGPGRWSRKEILGHLIDSATHNYQRFVRTQLAPPPLQLEPYDQDAWVRIGAYQHRPATELLTLWTSLNHQILHLLARLPDARLDHECLTLNANPVTLRWLIADYVLHLEHHIRQIIHH